MSLIQFQLQIAGPISTSFVPPFPVQQCHIDDQGVSVIVQVLDSLGSPVNLRQVQSKSIILVRPSGVSVEVPAAFLTNGFDGDMYFITSQTIPPGTGLDEEGIWLIQGKIVVDGDTQYTAIGSFQVNSNLGV